MSNEDGLLDDCFVVNIPYNGVILKGKFATEHRYFLAFAKTHCLIVALPSTITILYHICQNTPYCPKI
jgi:hypothetical protein